MNTTAYNQNRRAVAVYCGSSAAVDSQFIEAAYELGREAARLGFDTVTGAGANGLMGAVVEGTLDGGGQAIGVIPQFMVDRGWANKRMTYLHITADMHSRKMLMARLSSGAIALPGGVGTLDELMEIITWRQLGLYQHPVVMVNTLGYYDRLAAMLGHAADCGMMRATDKEYLWRIAATPAEALQMIAGAYRL